MIESCRKGVPLATSHDVVSQGESPTGGQPMMGSAFWNAYVLEVIDRGHIPFLGRSLLRLA